MKIKFKKIGRIIYNHFYFEAERGSQWIPDTLRRCYEFMDLFIADKTGRYKHWEIIREYIDIYLNIRVELKTMLDNHLRDKL